MGGKHASNTILDSNLEDKVLIEDESIVQPNITQVTIRLRKLLGRKQAIGPSGLTQGRNLTLLQVVHLFLLFL